MIGLKRYIRPGVVISALGHAGLVVLGLQLVGANSHEAIPPEAMVVEVVPPDEAPRFSGTPSNLRTSGSESSSPASAGNAAAQSPPPKPTAPAPQQSQKPPDSQRDARQAAAPAQTSPPPAPQAEMPAPQTPDVATAETQTPATQMSALPPPPAPSSEPADESRNEPGSADMLARLALAGGRLGGGFPAPPVDASFAAYDFTMEFRERVSSCSVLPAGVDSRDKISLKVRVSLNPNGTLASPPQPLEPVVSWQQQALMQSASDALQRCQPYTMLPMEKYKQWKTLDLVIVPTNFIGG
jgi:hypothetical protein